MLFYFTFPFGYSAYASQLLICVTIKEETQSKEVLQGGIEPPNQYKMLKEKTESNRIWKLEKLSYNARNGIEPYPEKKKWKSRLN